MERNGTPFNCEPIEAVFSSIYRFDTQYHTNAEGARLRSIVLGKCIAEILAGHEQAAKAIGREVAVADVTRRFEAQRSNFGEGDMPFQRRLRTLTGIKSYLEAYRTTNGSYPISPNPPRYSYDIGEFLPDGIERNPDDKIAYRSDGKGFKLLAVGIESDCPVVAANWPDMIDKVRLKSPLKCGAYGYWTPDKRSIW